MEHGIYYNESSEGVIKFYCHKLKIRTILVIFLICADAVMFYCLLERLENSLWGFLILPIFLLSLILLRMGIRVFNYRSFIGLSTILYYDCDPVKYQDVLNRLLVLDKKGKGRATLLLEMAAAALVEGKIDEGVKYLEQVTFRKFVLFRELKRLSYYAYYYDLCNDFTGLHRIKEELEKLKANLKIESRFNKEIEHQISLVQAMSSHEHESIDSQRKRWVVLYSMADNLLQENLYLMRLAKLELAQGKKELAIRHMRIVAAEGNTLVCVTEAMRILSMYETTESTCALVE